MSMLTPTGQLSRTRARKWRSVGRIVGVLFTLLVLAGLGAGAWWFLLRPVPARQTRACPPPAASPTASPVAPAPRTIRLNVYNATSRSGLAASVASQLRARGFVVVRVANDPLRRRVTGVAEVRHSARGAAAARTVSAQLGGRTVDVPDSRADASVDVVLGAGFTALATPQQAAAALAPTPTPTPRTRC